MGKASARVAALQQDVIEIAHRVGAVLHLTAQRIIAIGGAEGTVEKPSERPDTRPQ
jgi:hypothetical protein